MAVENDAVQESSEVDRHDTPPREVFTDAARVVLDRANELATFSETPDMLTRTFCCPAMSDAHQRLRTWMSAAGMSCHLDPACNLIGRYGPAGKPKLLIGSHLDTVANAGKFDGTLGVLLGLGLVELLRTQQEELPLAIELIAFSEEEGIRYRTPFLGSMALAGIFDPALLDRRDDAGITMRDAIAQFGGDPDHLDAATCNPQQVIGFIEPHIEQAIELDRADLPVGVVTAIIGQTRAAVRIVGEAGHAGTVPMRARRDALAAAAEWIVAVESIAAAGDDLVATVGSLQVEPNVANVIPGKCQLRLDIRHADNETRQAAFAEIIQRGEQISQRRGVEFCVEWCQENLATPADPQLVALLAQSVEAAGISPRQMPSRAGHDAAVMATRFPMAMLFVRSPGGVSHHPEETVLADDVAVALEVLWRFLNLQQIILI